VEDDATNQHERAVKFDFHTGDDGPHRQEQRDGLTKQ
jgi:hypothetical protein|tara:strand:+ start:335 stop:445 length:111 start_codon:yes stop_codon:yes gene_type:complete